MAPPDPTAAVPNGERAPPRVRADLAGRGDVEVDPTADDARGNRPDGDVADDGSVTARRADPALRDDHSQRDADPVHQAVEMHGQRADEESVDRRGLDVAQRGQATERESAD